MIIFSKEINIFNQNGSLNYDILKNNCVVLVNQNVQSNMCKVNEHDHWSLSGFTVETVSSRYRIQQKMSVKMSYFHFVFVVTLSAKIHNNSIYYIHLWLLNTHKIFRLLYLFNRSYYQIHHFIIFTIVMLLYFLAVGF